MISCPGTMGYCENPQSLRIRAEGARLEIESAPHIETHQHSSHQQRRNTDVSCPC